MATMEVDGTKTTNESSETAINGNGVHLPPVLPDASGEGLPYAPTNWPKLGDNWSWRVGKRVANNGHFLDRYLYLPKSLPRVDSSSGKKRGFASKLSVERYIQENFPGSDVDSFFASFSWKIPAKQLPINGNVEQSTFFPAFMECSEEGSESDSQSDGAVCKAGNKKCSSLIMQAEDASFTVMPCDICCTEPRFCHVCCCILCNKYINLNYGGYSYIKCEAKVGEGYICGHVAHLNCALRCYMAGTVGGSIGLDAEYCCRRCDSKTDLILHATKLVQTCESVDCRDDMEQILNLGFSILRGSQKASAKDLLNRIELAIKKLKHGTTLRDVWKSEEDSDTVMSTGVCHDENGALEVINHQYSPDAGTIVQPFLSTYSGHKSESRKLEEEIEKVLRALRNSQEYEWRIAEERLYAQKNGLCHLYQQLDEEKAELAQRTSEVEPNVLLDALTSRVEQIKREVMKLKDMAEVAIGFGRTSKAILKEYFDLDVED